MRNLILSLVAAALLASTADAALFGRNEDCTCKIPQQPMYGASNYYVAPQYAVAQPSSADLAKIFPAKHQVVAESKPVAKTKAIGKIDGPAKLTNDADAVYTVLCLPAHYRACSHCMATLNAFNTDPSLIEVRRQSKYTVLVAGQPRFTRAWAARVPEVRSGRTVVLLMQGNRVIAREVSPQLSGFGDRLKKKLCDKFCPECQPAEPPVDEEPIDEEPDTSIINPPIPPIEVADKTNPVAMLLTGLVVGVVAWWVMFRKGMN